MVIEAIIVLICGMFCSASVTWMLLSGNRKQRYIKQQWKQSEQDMKQWQRQFDALQTDEERKAAIDEILQGW